MLKVSNIAQQIVSFASKFRDWRIFYISIIPFQCVRVIYWLKFKAILNFTNFNHK